MAVLRRLGDDARPGLVPKHLLVVEAFAARSELLAGQGDGARVAHQVNDPEAGQGRQQRAHRLHRRAHHLRRPQPPVGDRRPQQLRAVGVDSTSIGPETRAVVVEDLRDFSIGRRRRRVARQRATTVLHALGRLESEPHAAVVARVVVALDAAQVVLLQTRPKSQTHFVPPVEIRPEFVNERLGGKFVDLGGKQVAQKISDGVDFDARHLPVSSSTHTHILDS